MRPMNSTLNQERVMNSYFDLFSLFSVGLAMSPSFCLCVFLLFPCIVLYSYTSPLGLLSSPMHSLFPAETALLYISGADCDGCLYIPNDGSSLTMGTTYYVRVTAYNALGSSAVSGDSGDESEVVAATPNQVNMIQVCNQCFSRPKNRIAYSQGINTDR